MLPRRDNNGPLTKALLERLISGDYQPIWKRRRQETLALQLCQFLAGGNWPIPLRRPSLAKDVFVRGIDACKNEVGVRLVAKRYRLRAIDDFCLSDDMKLFAWTKKSFSRFSRRWRQNQPV